MKKESRSSAILGLLILLGGFVLGVLSQTQFAQPPSPAPYSQEMELLRDL